MDKKVLLFDIGNSYVKWVLTPINTFRPLIQGRAPSKDIKLLENKLKLLKQQISDVENIDVYISSVKPSLNKQITNIFPNSYLLSIEDAKNLLQINYQTPETLGIDRIFNAIGGLNYSNSFNVISIGTAVVVDLIINKLFEGGNIFLGFDKHLECLSNNTELISISKMENINNITLPGKNTKNAVLGGIFKSIYFSLSGFIRFYNSNFNIQHVILTGGLAHSFYSFIRKEFTSINLILDPHLIYRGMLRVIGGNR